jgi:hypothetical protein
MTITYFNRDPGTGNPVLLLNLERLGAGFIEGQDKDYPFVTG